MAVIDRLEEVLARLAPTTREYAEHIIQEWVRNIPAAVSLAEALEMKDLARKAIVETPTAGVLREATRLESTANRAIKALGIPPDAVFGGEQDFQTRYLGANDGGL